MDGIKNLVLFHFKEKRTRHIYTYIFAMFIIVTLEELLRKILADIPNYYLALSCSNTPAVSSTEA